MHYSYLFTFWIYIYFILYLHNIININPILYFFLSLIRDIIFIIYIFDLNKTNYNIIFFIRLYLIISFHYIPLYFLIKTYNTSNNNTLIISILYFIILFIIYYIYITYNKLNIYTIYNNIHTKEYLYLSDYINDRCNTIFEFILMIFITLYINYKILIYPYK